MAPLPGISQEAQAGVEQLFIHLILLYFFLYFALAIVKSCVSLSGGWCLSLLMQSKGFGHSWFSQCFEDLFSWQRLAVIFVVEAAEILAGAQGWLWGAGGKGAAEHPCVKPSTSSCPWHLLPWGQQLPRKVYGFCFPQFKFALQNKGGRKENADFFF